MKTFILKARRGISCYEQTVNEDELSFMINRLAEQGFIDFECIENINRISSIQFDELIEKSKITNEERENIIKKLKELKNAFTN